MAVLWGQGGQGWQERCPGAQRLRAHIPGDLCCPWGCGSAGSGQDPLPAGTSGPAARLVPCCKSGAAPPVNTLQREFQIIIVECFTAVITRQCSGPCVISS